MTVRTYRKRPLTVEAIQYTGDNGDEVAAFMGMNEKPKDIFMGWLIEKGDGISIKTPEGRVKASVGDWVIRGVKGEFYPCKPDVFAETYEGVEE